MMRILVAIASFTLIVAVLPVGTSAWERNPRRVADTVANAYRNAQDAKSNPAATGRVR